MTYAELKRQWGLGHIKVKKITFKYYVNGELEILMNPKYTGIYGYYLDPDNVRRAEWLGSNSLKEAIDNLSERRIFVYSTDV